MTETNTAFRMIDHIGSKTRCIVFGFMRGIQILLAKDINVPSEIVCMCLLYYYYPEYFTTHGSDITLLDNGTVVKYNITGYSWEGNTVYGNAEINQNDYIKCIWSFQMVRLSKDPMIAVGITSAKTNVNEIFHTDDFDCGDHWVAYDNLERHTNFANAYAYSMYDGESVIATKSLYDRHDHEYWDYDYGCVCRQGDELKMELDIQNRTLKYYINSNDQGIAVKNVQFIENTTFVMAISVNSPVEIKLINFKAIYTKS
eukprot:526532_1